MIIEHFKHFFYENIVMHSSHAVFITTYALTMFLLLWTKLIHPQIRTGLVKMYTLYRAFVSDICLVVT